VERNTTVTGRKGLVVFPQAAGTHQALLYCFPHAGAGAAAFRSWSAFLPHWLGLGLVRLPGREDRLGDRPITDVRRAAHAIAAELRGHHPGTPFALFGHSLGALIAFETARALRRLGDEPRLLFVSGAPSPEHFRTTVVATASMSRQQLIATLRRAGGTPQDILENDEMLDIVLPAFEADRRLASNYEYEAEVPLPIPIIGLAAHNDHNVGEANVRAWSTETDGGFLIFEHAGDHFSVTRAPAEIVQIVIREFAQSLSIHDLD
jgi:medium-chain acyl-[acyl-carrier-protein] hydrolase